MYKQIIPCLKEMTKELQKNKSSLMQTTNEVQKKYRYD